MASAITTTAAVVVVVALAAKAISIPIVGKIMYVFTCKEIF